MEYVAYIAMAVYALSGVAAIVIISKANWSLLPPDKLKGK